MRRTKELIKKRTEIKQEFKLHNYRVFEKLLINDKRVNKYKYPYKVTYLINKFWTTATITIHQGSIQEHVNIR